MPDISSITELDAYYKNSLNNIKLLEEFYQDILKKFEEKNNSESDQGLMPIYLEKASCIEAKEISIPTNNVSENEKVELNLFLDSSYILPVNFEQINEKIKKESLVYKYDLKLIKGNVSSIYNLNKSNTNFESEDVGEGFAKLFSSWVAQIDSSPFLRCSPALFGRNLFRILIHILFKH